MNLTFLDARTEADRARRIWVELCEACNCSYFLSWGWMENWLRHVPPSVPLDLAVATEDGRPQAAFFVGRARVLRKRLFHSTAFFLNSTGVPTYDALCIEYNSFLSSPSASIRLAEVLGMLPDPWDEIVMPGLDGDAVPGRQLYESISPYVLVIDKKVPSPFVDLEMVRRRGGDYLSLLSLNTRQQIRRANKGYEAIGPLMLHVARTAPEALDILEDLVALHDRTWRDRGERGAFASSFFSSFHRQLITSRFAHGEIQLLRLTRGEVTVGCLYNFVWKGKVYFYQSGFRYETDQRLKPGLVCHTAAIVHNAQAGNLVYDFLGGAARYKLSLSTHQRPLIWARIQKPRVRFRMEQMLRQGKRAFLRLVNR